MKLASDRLGEASAIEIDNNIGRPKRTATGTIRAEDMETLEYAYQLMCRRPGLEALANGLTSDRRLAQTAVERVLFLAWKSREVLAGEDELDLTLKRWCRAALAESGWLDDHPPLGH